MFTIEGDNINQTASQVVDVLAQFGYLRDSRNGPVWALDRPLSMRLERPWERILFWPQRKLNPFLNFFDGLFSLSIVNDPAFMEKFSKQFMHYSDHDSHGQPYFQGHYGTRLRKHQRYGDQLAWAIDRLRNNADDRRVVMSYWGHPEDSLNISKDVPCNVLVIPKVDQNERLSMMVVNRSNDIAWGLLGVNPVQFSMLQEIMAAALGRPMGSLTHITMNLHGYMHFGPWVEMVNMTPPEDIYQSTPHSMTLVPMLDTGEKYESLLDDIDALVTCYDSASKMAKNFWKTRFFYNVALPVFYIHDAWKQKTDKATLLNMVEGIEATDWCYAISSFLNNKKA